MITLLHLTDTHLYAAPGRALRGVDTADSLAAVVAAVRRDRAWPPAAVLATGDLAEDESEAAYRRLRSLLAPLDRPVYCLPGNHDDPRAMHAVLNAAPFSMQREVVIDDWRVLMLDSLIPGSAAGRLGEDELRELDALLARDTGRHVLVCVHHHPVPMGSLWLDRHLLADAAALFAALDTHPRVRGVVWGHVHRPWDSTRGALRLLATPSTCGQFRPGSERFATDDRPPAWRWLHLHADGSLDTRLCWLNGAAPTV